MIVVVGGLRAPGAVIWRVCVCVCVLLLCVRVCVCWGVWDVRYRERFASRVQPSGDRGHAPPFSGQLLNMARAVYVHVYVNSFQYS
jgi:hypothetical protein